MTISQTLLGFDDLDGFEEYWSDNVESVLQVGFFSWLDWGSEDPRGEVPVSSYQGYLPST